ncbi:MAG TPA: fumarylacetoacetate hydrolase family protein [Burkholderiales bacterium]|nr:fumarylacetoacetate hydrolase family protein [Burkholderiales bacterium]
MLEDARRTGKKVPRLADELRPRDEKEASLVRDTVMQLRNSRRGGWKVALSAAGELIASPILSDGLFATPARIPKLPTASLGIETELAFRIKRAFPAAGEAVSARTALEAIDAVMPALELLDSRYEAGFGSPRLDLLADHLGNFGIVLGSVLQGWRERNLAAVEMSLVVAGSKPETVNGAHPLNDPVAPLVALAKHLAREGDSIAPGDVVITGSWTGVRHVSVVSNATVMVDQKAVLELSVGEPTPFDGERN